MDPYVYPGTNVLKNLRGIHDPDRLSRFEMDMTTRRLVELAHNALLGQFDSPHLQAIHRYIFQDVFAWAGEFRTVNIGKSGDLFALHPHIAGCVHKTFQELREGGDLRDASLDGFCSRAAYFLGEINAVHPFRDGNGRAQREFIKQLAFRNGYSLDWSRVSGDQMMEASRRSFRRDNSGLEMILNSATSYCKSHPAS